MKRRFPITAKPIKTSLSIDILEDRVPVSEQIGTVIGLSMLSNAQLMRWSDFDLEKSFPTFQLKLDPVATAQREFTPTEQIALVRPPAEEPAETTAYPFRKTIQDTGSWNTDSLNPALVTDLDQDPFAPPWETTNSRRVTALGLPPNLLANNSSPEGAGGLSAGLAPDSGKAGSDSNHPYAADNGDNQAGHYADNVLAAAFLNSISNQAGNNPGLIGTVNTQASPVTTPSQPRNSHTGGGTDNPPGGPTLPPRRPNRRTRDPLFVLDAQNAIVLDPNVIKHDYSTYNVDLRAQVSGASVQSYTWTFDNSTDYTNVTGTYSYDLQFRWGTFTGVHDHLITLAYSTGSQNYSYGFPFRVYGTDSPPVPNPPQPTTWSTWQPNSLTLISPDAIKPDQEINDSQYYSVGLVTGDLMMKHELPTYNPGIPPVVLQYSSVASDHLPIFTGHFQINPNRETPVSVNAALTITTPGGDVTGPTTIYSTSNWLNPGGVMQIALQATYQSKPSPAVRFWRPAGTPTKSP
jgi:hypothetical protein